MVKIPLRIALAVAGLCCCIGQALSQSTSYYTDPALTATVTVTAMTAVVAEEVVTVTEITTPSSTPVQIVTQTVTSTLENAQVVTITATSTQTTSEVAVVVTVTVTEGSISSTAMHSTRTVTYIVTATPTSSTLTTTTTTMTSTSSSSQTPIITTKTYTAIVTSTLSKEPTIYYSVKCNETLSCPENSSFIMKNNQVLSCIRTLSNGKILSTTCVESYCCTSSASTSQVLLATTCKAFNVNCPSGYTAAVDSNGASAPCTVTSVNGELTGTTCNQSTCCQSISVTTQYITYTSVVTTVPSTTSARATTGNNRACSSVIKCKKYKRNSKTNAVLRCDIRAGQTNFCSKSRCCRS